MAKPNYQFEKRQRDLAKKAKQEEKRRHKLAGKTTGTDQDGDESAAAPDAPAAPASASPVEDVPAVNSTALA